MSKEPGLYTVTAALPYANGPVHIGHVAGCYLPADIYVRYLRARGDEALFVCGSDEHGVPITIKARNEGITPQEVVDTYHRMMEKAFADFGISFDIYGRTSDKGHHAFSASFFKSLYDSGVFHEEITQQFYDPVAQQFLADRYITGTCPVCSNPGAYGDQCERCGSTLNPTDLIDPKSALSGAQPEMRDTKNWFLPLDAYQGDLEDYVASKHWKSNVLGQCKSWLAEGLKPRAMTRDLDWGVAVPVADAIGKVLYVWFDAPLGYISNTQAYFERHKISQVDSVESDLPVPSKHTWEDFWLDQGKNNQHLVHFIGKDNIVFHTIIFPAMLMAYNKHRGNKKPFILPEQVPANEFLNLEGQKISTSRNWAVWLHEYIDQFPDRNDEMRYYLTSIAPETKDADFTWKGFQLAVNSELVAVLGNFVNRVLVLTHKFYDGKVPVGGDQGEREDLLMRHLTEGAQKIHNGLDQFRFRDSQEELMQLFRYGNKYLAETEPWHLIKTDPARTETVIRTALEYCLNLAVLCGPFLPETSRRMGKWLGVSNKTILNAWNDLREGRLLTLTAGNPVLSAGHLFKPIDDADIQREVEKLESKKMPVLPENNPSSIEKKSVSESKPVISFDQFAAMDIRVATILAAEAVPQTEKLLKLTLDTGLDKRTVVSGIAKHYQPDAIVGRQVLILANLAPRPMRGIVSEGMILMAQDAEGRLVFVSPENAIANGSTVQ